MVKMANMVEGCKLANKQAPHSHFKINLKKN